MTLQTLQIETQIAPRPAPASRLASVLRQGLRLVGIEGSENGFQHGVHVGAQDGASVGAQNRSQVGVQDGALDGHHDGSNDGLIDGSTDGVPHDAPSYEPFEIHVADDGTLVDRRPGDRQQPGAAFHAERFLLWLQDSEQDFGGEWLSRSLLERLYSGPFLGEMKWEPSEWRTIAMHFAQLRGVEWRQRDRRRGLDRKGSSPRAYYIPKTTRRHTKRKSALEARA